MRRVHCLALEVVSVARVAMTGIPAILTLPPAICAGSARRVVEHVAIKLAIRLIRGAFLLHNAQE
jgi:hypothetical protein